jgi:hypothetical protein
MTYAEYWRRKLQLCIEAARLRRAPEGVIIEKLSEAGLGPA